MKVPLKNKGLWLVVLVVLVGGGIWLATKGSGSNITLNKDLQNKCMTDVNDELFCKFAGAFGAVSSFKVSANVTSESGTSALELATDSKDNNQMVVKVNGQEQANIVVFNNTTYSKDYTDGKWFKYSSSDSTKPAVTDLKKEFTKGDFKADNGQKIDYVKIGTEKCGGLTCYKYQVKDPTKTGQEGFMWFDTKDYLLRRLTIKDATSNTDMNVTYTAVSITEPSPTKDVPSFTQ